MLTMNMAPDEQFKVNMLFDEEERHYTGVAQHAESYYSFLNRSSRHSVALVRDMLECWLARFPKTHQKSLATRMRHTGRTNHQQDTNFRAAFFELYMHEFLRGTGSQVTVEPNVEGLKPDFSVDEADERFLVEVTCLSFDPEDRKEKRVVDLLNTIDAPQYFLAVSTEGSLTDDIPKEKLLTPFKNLVCRTNYDDLLRIAKCCNGLLPKGIATVRVEHKSWVITGQLIPVNEGNRKGSFVGILPATAFFFDDIGRFREKVRDKARRYRQHPVIIAVQAGRIFNRIEEALFGSRENGVRGSRGSSISEPYSRHRPDGLWYGNKGPRYQNVIGVAVFYDLSPLSVGRVQSLFCANPYVDVPLPAWARAIDHWEYTNGIPELVKGLKPSTFLRDYVDVCRLFEEESRM